MAEIVVPNIATMLIATALWGGRLKTRINVGTKINPPPNPHMDAGKPTPTPNAMRIKKNGMLNMSKITPQVQSPYLDSGL